jgi:hypothetical protein
MPGRYNGGVGVCAGMVAACVTLQRGTSYREVRRSAKEDRGYFLRLAAVTMLRVELTVEDRDRADDGRIAAIVGSRWECLSLSCLLSDL